MGFLLALSAAVAFGASHFLGGMASRRSTADSVALFGMISGLVVTLAVGPFAGGGFLSVSGLGWGVVSGVGSGLGVLFLYRGLAIGNMSVVSPLSEIAAVVLPVLVGLLLGERLTLHAIIGTGIALPATWLISSSPRNPQGRTERADTAFSHDGGVLYGLMAGAGFGLHFIALAQVTEAAGLWPMAASRVAATLLISAWVVYAGIGFRLRRESISFTIASGSIGTTASILFMLATQRELLAIAAPLTSLYPVIPVLAGYVILRERISTIQTWGLAGAAVAVLLLGIA